MAIGEPLQVKPIDVEVVIVRHLSRASPTDEQAQPLMTADGTSAPQLFGRYLCRRRRSSASIVREALFDRVAEPTLDTLGPLVSS